MPRFKVIQKSVSYEHAYIEAASKEEVLKLHNDGMLPVDEWKFDECGDSELIGVDEDVPGGGTVINDVENGEFVCKRCCDCGNTKAEGHAEDCGHIDCAPEMENEGDWAAVDTRRLKVVSLLDVLIRYASYYSDITTALIELEELFKPLEEAGVAAQRLEVALDHDKRLLQIIIGELDRIDKESRALELKRTADRARRMRERLQIVGSEFRRDKYAIFEVKALREALQDDLKEYRIFIPSLEQAQYHCRPKLFGEKVYEAFPSTRDDILEAGNCYATDNFTACGFHLMRVGERGMRVLAKHLKVEKIGKAPIEYVEWDVVCKAIKKRIDEIQQHTSRGPQKAALLKRYSDAASQAEYLNDIWRKDVSHARQPYNAPEALSALTRVREFMQSLSEWLCEPAD